MKRLLLAIFFLFSISIISHSKVTLPPIFADNMVLQQQTDAAIWGNATPDTKVVITNTWSKDKVVVRSDAEGKWFARVSTPVAGGPYNITVSDGEKLTLKNVLIGEVWICAGQSNMEMPMKGFLGQPVTGSEYMILGAKPSVPIRMCTVHRNVALEPQEECKTVWYEHTPEGVAESSATAYYFSKMLHETLDIPVGFICVSYGGSTIQAWMDPEILRTEFADDFDFSHLDEKFIPENRPHRAPGLLYNGMLSTVVPFTAKGFLWYQGCSNSDIHQTYKRLQPSFVKMLRREWGNEEMPFYFVQIAPYGKSKSEDDPRGNMFWAQAQTLEMIPNSGMVCIFDAGEPTCIHPANKKIVGDRLAFQVLEFEYGISVIDSRTPMPIKFEFNDGEAIVTFDFVSRRGIGPINQDLEGFELAGEDRIFYPAKGQVISKEHRNQVRVYDCPQVTKPVAVRYGIKDGAPATLYNCYGIPVTPFRSDDW